MKRKRNECESRFCKAHKENEMVDVKNKVCEFDGCSIRSG